MFAIKLRVLCFVYLWFVYLLCLWFVVFVAIFVCRWSALVAFDLFCCKFGDYVLVFGIACLIYYEFVVYGICLLVV